MMSAAPLARPHHSGLTLRDLSPDQLRVYTAILRWLRDKDWTTQEAERVFTMGGVAGTGKALSLETLIPTPQGWRTMNELQAGDYVFAPDGSPTKVTYVSPIQHERVCYRVEFSDGAHIVADEDHLWVTFTERERDRATRNTPEWRAARRAKRTPRGTGARPWLAERNSRLAAMRTHALKPAPTGGTRTTQEILRSLRTKRGSINHSVAVAQPLEYPPQELLVDPYILGLWLGDGSTSGGYIHKPDEEIFAALRVAGYRPVRPEWGRGITVTTRGLRAQLRILGVLGNKHIPEIYLRAPVEQRLALAQGLFDTDGSACEGGSVEFTSTSYCLAHDVWELLISLGCKATLSEGVATLNGREIGPKWRIYALTELPLFRLPRKLQHQKRAEFRGTHLRRYITNIVQVPSVPVKCIQVDHPSHCYLASEWCIPTHNTTLLGLLLEHLTVQEGKSVAVLTPTGKAACVLRAKLASTKAVPIFLGTIHSFMYIPVLDANEELIGWKRRYFEKQGDTYIAKGGGDIPQVDLIVVDESSMLNQDLEDDITAFGVPVLAVGDHAQLPPVQGKNTWMAEPRARLEKVHRQAEGNPIIALATFIRETGTLPKAALEDIGIGYFKSLDAANETLLRAYQTQSLHEVVLLTYTNALRCRLNTMIHNYLQGNEPKEGSQIICLRNDNSTGLVNGMRGFIQGEVQKAGPFYFSQFFFPDEKIQWTGKCPIAQFGHAQTIPNVQTASELLGAPVKRMSDLGALIDYGYALTTHKFQGSQAREVFVCLQSGMMPRDFSRWAYTAITRASEKLHFVETRG
jgi:hypothetical protein